jgi:hypothetical protein
VTLSRARAELERWGFLLLQDPRLPSLATLVAGEPVIGSWWGHPRGGDIFRIAGELDDEVVTAKLIDGKVTFLHRRLWAPLAAVGRARDSWQTARLPAPARALLARVDRDGRVRAAGAAAKQLEQRLLCASEQVHTETGAHATELHDWTRFARARRLGRLPAPAAARSILEQAVAAVAVTGKPPRLPWR